MTTTRHIRFFVASAIVIVATAATTVTPWLASMTGESPLANTASSVGAVMLAVVGALVLVRRPGNRMGAVFSVAGLLWAVGAACDRYASLAYEVRGEPLPGGLFAAWVSEWFWIPWLFLTFVFTGLLFPTGRLPSPRWRPVGWIAGLTAVVITGLAMLESELQPSNTETVAHNPFGIPGHADVEEGILGLWFIVFFASVLASLASLIVRYRRAPADERQQIKLVTYAACVLVTVFLFGVLGYTVFAFKLPVVESLLNAVLPIAAGVAILKHRLFDLDVVISRALVFGGLAAFITAIYVGIVVGIGSLLGAGGEPNLALSIVATAVVAVAFQPVRERLTRLANRLVFGKRATPYEVLSRFSSHLSETVATEDTLQRMARLLADGTGAGHAEVSLAIGGQMVPASSVGEVVDASTEAHTVEVTHQGETLGALSVTKKRGETLTPTDVKLVDDLAAQAGLLLRNVRLTEQLRAKIVELRASRQRLVAAQDAERRRLERDLHDGAQQQIVAMKLKVGMARTVAERLGADELRPLLDQLWEESDEAVEMLRNLAHGIYPPLLESEGLAAALTSQARKTGLPVSVETGGLGRYDREVEAAVYFCVSEALQNVAKYADPTQVAVRLEQADGHLEFTVADDGVGFDPATTPTGHGTTNMADRLDALGGELDIRSAPGAGTTVSGRVSAAAATPRVPTPVTPER